MTEIWKPVVGHTGYEVSNLGRVRSLDRIIEYRNRRGVLCFYKKQGRILRPGIASNGYPTVALYGVTRTMHSLVIEAFIGPRLSGMEVRHLDGKRTNCILDNLAYGTPADNRADSKRHGTMARGSQYSSAKLNEAKARVIRSLKGKVSQSTLAKRYSVSPAAIQAVHDGRTWTHA